MKSERTLVSWMREEALGLAALLAVLVVFEWSGGRAFWSRRRALIRSTDSIALETSDGSTFHQWEETSVRNASRRIQRASLAYHPGVLNVNENGLLLSEGLTSRLLAKTGSRLSYDTGGASSIPCHDQPDAGETFADYRTENFGGWIYVSNSEVRDNNRGGAVGAFTFDKGGRLI